MDLEIPIRNEKNNDEGKNVNSLLKRDKCDKEKICFVDNTNNPVC